MLALPAIEFAIRANRDYTASLPMTRRKTQPTLPGVTDRRIAALLTLLAENATIVVSGARIAREIGVSRASVWRGVNR
jgi:hypothetical protein